MAAKQNIVNITSGQTLLDIAIEKMGSAEAFFDLCRLNGLSYSADLQAAQSVKYALVPYDAIVFKFYQDRRLKPASGSNLPGQLPPETLDGIGYWIIENDFIVS